MSKTLQDFANAIEATCNEYREFTKGENATFTVEDMGETLQGVVDSGDWETPEEGDSAEGKESNAA